MTAHTVIQIPSPWIYRTTALADYHYDPAPVLSSAELEAIARFDIHPELSS